MSNHKNGAADENQHSKDTKFSFFNRPIKNTTPSKDVTLTDVYNRIVSEDFAATTAKARLLVEDLYSQFKAANFDYVTFNGTFSERKESCLLKPSQYFIIDIDHLIASNLIALFERLQNDKILAVQLMFISPGGDGLKIVIKIDFSIIDTTVAKNIMNPIWQATNSYFGKHYADLITPNKKGDFIDGACKDLSRATFLCHDAKAYLNINATVHGHQFLEDYPPLEPPLATKNNRQKTVNPATTLQDLAARHLLETENHHPELRAFIGAAKTIGTPIDHTLDFITCHVSIAENSSYHGNNDAIKRLVEDLYSRYNTDSDEVVYLTPLTFGYKILHFKYVKDIGQFVVSSLFTDEVRNVLHKAGFAKRKIGNGFLYIQSKGCIISEVSTEMMRDYLTSYVTSIEQSFSFTYQNILYQIPAAAIRETYFKNSNNIFNEVWLEHLQIHNEPIFKDTTDEMYFFFKNCIVTVSREGIKSEGWDEKTGFCVWDEQLIKHDFEYIEDSTSAHFYKFLLNVTNNDKRRLITMLTGIGYLLHHHFRESEGQAVVFYDESITDTSKPMGGSGKGLIVNAIKQVRKVVKVDGKHLDGANRFRWEQVTPSTQVVWLDDVKPDFDFSLLHSNLTDGWTVERKYLSQFMIEPIDSPKTVICSNSIIKGGGTTNKRRQFIIELSDFYSSQIVNGDEKPIEQTHGGLFFSNTSWNANEWNMFFSVMMDAAYQYLNNSLVSHEGVNVDLNRFKQATDEDFATWVVEQGFEKKNRYETKTHFEPYVTSYYGATHQIGQRKFTGWLKEYAAYKKWGFEVEQSGGISFFTFK